MGLKRIPEFFSPNPGRNPYASLVQSVTNTERARMSILPALPIPPDSTVVPILLEFVSVTASSTFTEMLPASARPKVLASSCALLDQDSVPDFTRIFPPLPVLPVPT